MRKVKCTILFLLLVVSAFNAQNANEILVNANNIDYLIKDDFSLSLSNLILKKVPFKESYIKENKIKSITLVVEKKRDTNLTKYSFNAQGGLIEVKKFAKVDLDVETFKFKSHSADKVIYNQRYIGEYINMNYDYEGRYQNNKITFYKNVELLQDITLEDGIKSTQEGEYIFIKDDLFVTKCFFYLKDEEYIKDAKLLKNIAKKVIKENDANYRRGVHFLFHYYKDNKLDKSLEFKSKDEEENILLSNFTYDTKGFLIKKSLNNFFTPQETIFQNFQYDKDGYLLMYSSNTFGKEKKSIFSYQDKKISEVKNYEVKNGERSLKNIIKYIYEYIQ